MHYTSWLLVPSIFGLILFGVQTHKLLTTEGMEYTDAYDSAGNGLYALLIMVWTTMMVESWKRKENYIAD